MISLFTALILSGLVEKLLFPNPCLYHTSEYLAGKEAPWWVTTFFPLDSMRHPESGLLFYALTVFVLSRIIFWLLTKKESLES